MEARWRLAVFCAVGVILFGCGSKSSSSASSPSSQSDEYATCLQQGNTKQTCAQVAKIFGKTPPPEDRNMTPAPTEPPDTTDPSPSADAATPTPVESTTAPQPENTPTMLIRLGDVAKLATPAYCFDSTDSIDELGKAAVADDKDGMRDVIGAHSVGLDQGTKVRMIDNHMSGYGLDTEVRVQSGSNEGAACWISNPNNQALFVIVDTSGEP